MQRPGPSPGKAGGGACVSSERASYRQASQEAPNTPSPASPAPPPVNGGSSRCVLQLLGIEYYPASLEAGSESPFTLHGKAGACVSPERASYRQVSQEALKKSAACITCPAARKRAPFVQDYLSGNRKVVHFFPLRPMLEAKAFLLSPALLEGHFAKAYKAKSRAAPFGAARLLVL